MKGSPAGLMFHIGRCGSMVDLGSRGEFLWISKCLLKALTIRLGRSDPPANQPRVASTSVVRWEPAGRLLGVDEPAIHGNLEHTTAGPVQLHLRAGCLLLDQTCRRTGARFIASHSAIFDLNLHNLFSRLSRTCRNNSSPRPFTSRSAAVAERHKKCTQRLPEFNAACSAFSGASGPGRDHRIPRVPGLERQLSRKLYVPTTAEG